jgi:isoleucyl-tRNA synthetase
MSDKESLSRYKDTIILPKTDFPMRGNLPQTEPLIIEKWQKQNIYQKIIKKNSGQKKFVMPDGPPYANGNIHIGHVLNKVLKDVVVKYKNMRGLHAEFIPGWDCHGLPIELKVTKELGSKKNDLSKKEIRDLCRKEAHKWIDTQKAQFVRLGALAEWDNPYLTLDPLYEAEEVRVLAKIHRNGVLYRGNKPVYWCPALQTALAAAEVEYHDHTSPSIYVKFELKKPRGSLAKLKGKVSLVIWTTTPWTIPANYGIALNEKFTYGAYKVGAEYLIIATELAESVSKETGIELNQPEVTFKGGELEKQNATHPFMNRESLIILGDHVSLEAGTGAVHTAPGHGMDDYHVGLKYGLPVASPVDGAGRFTDEVPLWQGVKIWEGNKLIVEHLKSTGHLLSHKDIVHSYPHNPRSKTPLIFRATPQWFIRMDDDFNLRAKALKCAETEIQYVPAWGKPRLISMLTNTPDWCLSRQRIWGVPIPVFYCAKCEEPLAKVEVMEKVADLMESSKKGIEAYFDEAPATFTQGEKCAACGHTEFTRSEDILDVWFDSGVCHTAVQQKRAGLDFPADIYLEGSDQHRGWFQTSLVSSMAAYEKAPFKTLITHGFVNDAQGHKMSKSKGNVVDPADVTKKFGAEILRLWVAHEDYGEDVTVSDEMFLRISESYRRIRNTHRFLLGNLFDFDPDKNAIPLNNLPAMDRWALARLNQVVDNTNKAFENYEFFKVYHLLNNFFSVDLSATYLDILKDRLYTSKADGLRRRASQTVLYEIISNLTRLMAPILSFLAEETYSYLPGKKQESVFLADYPTAKKEWESPELLAEFEKLIEVRSEVQKKLEDLRRDKVIGSSLEAAVNIQANGEVLGLLKKYESDLREILIVSDVTLLEGAFKVDVVKAKGEKCERCWNLNIETGKNQKFPGVCPKCVEALS